MIELPRTPLDISSPSIKVFGIGNAGCNALDRLVLDGLPGIEALAINTDAQALVASIASSKLQVGAGVTRGLGAGGDPELGLAAVEGCADEVRARLQPANIIFLLVGLGGGTGSGAAPLVAQLAREENALVVVFATMPFSFEGKRRSDQAQAALSELRARADVVICFENDKMGDSVSVSASIQEAFAAADKTISQSVRAMIALAGRRGLVHAGFDEIAAAVRGNNSRCLFGYGEAEGNNRPHDALAMAFRNPLLDRTLLREQVESVIVSISGGHDLTLNEVQIFMEEFNRHLREDTRIYFGVAIDPALSGRFTAAVFGVFGTAQSQPRVVERTPVVAATPVVQIEEPEPEIDPEESRWAGPADEEPEPVEEPAPAHAYAAVEEAVAVHEEAPFPPKVSPLRGSLPPARPPLRSATRPGLPPRSGSEPQPEHASYDSVNRGRFEKSEPTIIDGQDLDVPTFMRRSFRPQ